MPGVVQIGRGALCAPFGHAYAIAVKKYIALLIATMMASCAAPVPAPSDLCEMPKHLASWNGADVRWSGIIIGTFDHGFILVTEKCRHRGIPLDWRSDEAGHALEAPIRREWTEAGIIRASLSGRIAGQRLLVTKVHHVALFPMNEGAEREHMRALGF
jgi:hypothetical protein